ncbi:MAG: N utilization substance protein B, partial [Myxococcota bacterium]
MGNRRKARECALQLLYGLEFNTPQDGAQTRQYLADFWGAFPEESSANDDVRAFAEALVLGVRNHDERIDKLITKASTNWKLERMALVDRNILRIATLELKHLTDIPA